VPSTWAYPTHPHVAIREDVLMAATATFFADYVFGPDRAAMLDAQLPADAAQEAAQRATRAKKLDQRLDQIETAQQALITELETPADPDDPAAGAFRERIRTRYRELHGECAALETQRDQLDTTTTQVATPHAITQLLADTRITPTTQRPSLFPFTTPPERVSEFTFAP
jgi:ATP-dependent Clp protease ATP-binding subunit ClpA